MPREPQQAPLQSATRGNGPVDGGVRASTADWSSMRGVGGVSVIGCVGSLIVATRGVAGVGEVLLNVRGTKEAYLRGLSCPSRGGPRCW